ncbi:MAG: SDR family NAD(P)-dependent oxidoreductase [Gaiellaceae bacterium]
MSAQSEGAEDESGPRRQGVRRRRQCAGVSVAETLVGEGARVIPVSRDEGALDEVAAALDDAAVPFAADLADATAVDALAARVNAEVGALDGILVNAGGPPPGSTLDFSDEQREGAFRSSSAAPSASCERSLPGSTREPRPSS